MSNPDQDKNEFQGHLAPQKSKIFQIGSKLKILEA